MLRRALISLVAAAAAFGIGAAVGAVQTSGSHGDAPAIAVPSRSPSASPSAQWKGIWPQRTAAAAETAQSCADAGTETCTWQRSAFAVVHAYVTKVLHWDPRHVYVRESLRHLPDPDVSGPLTVHVGRCPVGVDGRFPTACRQENVTIERLLKRDRTGVWFVTSARNPVLAERAAIARAPRPVAPVSGRRYWAVYYAVQAPGSSALVVAVSDLRQLGLHPFTSDLGCDRGASRALLGYTASGKSAVAFYFNDKRDAEAFSRAVSTVPRVGIVNVARVCGA